MKDFGTAMLTNGYGIIQVHNHPSDDPTLSTEHKLITNKLVQINRFRQIPFLNHIIIEEADFHFPAINF